METMQRRQVECDDEAEFEEATARSWPRWSPISPGSKRPRNSWKFFFV